ncbi:type II 3-dehydroquinate dehydratase [Marinicella sp. S1101]|uniref:type II 3-dehydroquinate dehydratase n=1 Tax=Marinicella marina TaxID=2996016 RepID=UPI002260D9C5|nr:type II 3-dehydroquinate dehydratase [Marinicella marina]MCX7552885.1 type II 3-dehydroquinate dehydratase [Marinicella marina]MDJ1139806.1 type II 3-dehydroquinate dehydratase [Marinicella marina]
MREIAIINGPNLNLLGVREPEVYGTETLQDINDSMLDLSKQLGLSLRFKQANAEHELVDFIHQCFHDQISGIIINPAAFTHTSVAIRDALLGTQIPFIEVHLSNVHAREDFRSKSWLSDVAIGTITGLGSKGYEMALRYWASEN